MQFFATISTHSPQILHSFIKRLSQLKITPTYRWNLLVVRFVLLSGGFSCHNSQRIRRYSYSFLQDFLRWNYLVNLVVNPHLRFAIISGQFFPRIRRIDRKKLQFWHLTIFTTTCTFFKRFFNVDTSTPVDFCYSNYAYILLVYDWVKLCDPGFRIINFAKKIQLYFVIRKNGKIVGDPNNQNWLLA